MFANPWYQAQPFGPQFPYLAILLRTGFGARIADLHEALSKHRDRSPALSTVVAEKTPMNLTAMSPQDLALFPLDPSSNDT
ncbi:hypothetical protein J1614_003253 [Plenodomus biglobosus]|nr:hypothetical protein J1614_003253 [Plenodomus biglobosus]